MGHNSNQDRVSSIHRPTPTSDGPQSLPPPLPPRAEPAPVVKCPPPPSVVENANHQQSQRPSQDWSKQDPRSSSTQSLHPSQEGESIDKRTLLLIWLHGFMGNETSFQSFPAHVHNYLAVKMGSAGAQATHQVHTKIYPKYKSRNKIEKARDGFSDW